MKAKKLSFVSFILLFAGLNLVAQTAERPYALGINFGKLEFWGNAGNAGIFKSGQNFDSFLGLTFRGYSDNNFDFSFNADMGKISYKLDNVELFKENLFLFALNAHYKFYNGYLLPESSRIGPFITGGAGIEKNWNKGSAWDNQVAVVFPVGVGVNINITDRWTVQLQSLLNFSLHNPYRNTDYGYTVDDKFWKHCIGIFYNFSSLCCHKGGKVTSAPPLTPAPAPQVSEETKKIFEQALQGIQFETGSDVIKAESFPILDQVVKVMQDNPGYRLEINGHTDNQGKPKMNMELSQKRSVSVQKYLSSKGVDSNRLKPQGFGDTRPVADNGTAEGRARNRRVEFKVY